MKYSLFKIYSTYKDLQRVNNQYNYAREIVLEQLLGKDLAEKAKNTVFTPSALLYFLEKTQNWDEKEKFLNEFILTKKFEVGTKYILYSSKGWYQVGTATIHERFRIEDSEYIIIITNIKGRKSVKTCKVNPHVDNFETTLINSKYVIYSDKPYETEESSNRN